MENTVARRATSIALMAIMVAGGMTIAFPGATPDAMAAPRSLANLSVSTTVFGGPMVIEIIVRDPNIDDTGIQQGAPDVTFDGKDLIMIQGDDGYWYAYVANVDMIRHVEAFMESDRGETFFGMNDDVRNGYFNAPGTGMDFGRECIGDQADAIITGKDFSADAVFVANVTCGSESGQTTDVSVRANNVMRSAKTPSTPGGVGSDPGDNIGNNGMTSLAYWPFIQAFDDISDDSRIKVTYNKGGSPQEITIKYESDMDDLASLTLDRENYPHESFVHMTLEESLFNIDPTDEDVWSWHGDNGDVYYYVFNSDRTVSLGDTETDGLNLSADLLSRIDFGTSGPIRFDRNQLTNLDGNPEVLMLTPRDEAVEAGQMPTGNGDRFVGRDFGDGGPFVTVKETGANTGIFTNTDGRSTSDLITNDDRIGREVPFGFTYADTAQNWFVGYTTAVVSMDTAAVGSDWGSGEELPVSVTDQDLNRNSLVEEYLRVNGALDPLRQTSDLDDDFRLGVQLGTGGEFVMVAPSKSIPIGIGTGGAEDTPSVRTSPDANGDSQITMAVGTGGDNLGTDKSAIGMDGNTMTGNILTEGLEPGKALFLEWDISDVNPNSYIKLWVDGGDGGDYFTGGTPGTFLPEGSKGHVRIDNHPNRNVGDTMYNGGTLRIGFSGTSITPEKQGVPLDVRIILRLYDIDTSIDTLKETGPNTGVFDGTIEYVMLNQLNTELVDGVNVANAATAGLATGLTEDIVIVLDGDYLDEDGIRVDYVDTDKQGQQTVVSAKIDAPTHSGSISLDQDSYKKADTVQITLNDADLNLDTELRDVYTAITTQTVHNRDTISRNVDAYPNDARDGLMLAATFDDKRWLGCLDDSTTDLNEATTYRGFGSLIGNIRETAPTSGVFVADFQVPDEYCTVALDDRGNPRLFTEDTVDPNRVDGVEGDLRILKPVTTLGKDLEVSYYDFFDSAGERNEVGDVAGITSFTGSVSLDRSVYPVPFAPLVASDSAAAESTPAKFRYHETFRDSNTNTDTATRYIDDLGPVTIHIQINDKDLDASGSGTDRIEVASDVLAVEISRDGNRVAPASGTPDALDDEEILETSPTSGIFELDLDILWNDGPSAGCPTGTGAFAEDDEATTEVDEGRCLLQGDIITVTYTDASDATGNTNTVTDSATFDLRNGVLQSDKSVYIIGSDMILTLIDPDLDLDNDGKQSYSLDIIEWDSDAATITMGDGGGSPGVFDPEPARLQETGDSTGIFQTILEIPEAIEGEELDRGEEIALEYTDWGPSGADFVGEESQDIGLTVFTSNFGATIELDQKVYTWTDKVFITIVAPDHNFDSSLIDEIGRDASDPLQIATQEGKIDNYRLAETGPDTGIFTGEVILTGFDYEVNDDITVTPRGPTGDGPTDGLLPATDDDGVTVSYEYSEDETVVGSSLIRWNIGEAEWLAASYPASGTGVIRVIDPDMNTNPEAVDNFQITVISDSVASGISLTVTETSQAAGIFEGTVFFTTTDAPTGSRLRVAEGDTITAEYDDTTLPDPYSRGDELTVSATALIGTIVPPLERVPVSNLRVVDNFGSTLDTVQVDQQVQVTADLTNGQTRDQAFAYLVQIQDEDNVTVHLAWISGSVAEGQSFSPSVSWTPAASGSYTATTFAWESVSNPEALSPPVSLEITVG